MNSDVSWIDSINQCEIEPQIEINFDKKELNDLFRYIYKDWKILDLSSKEWIDNQIYLDKQIEYRSNCFTFIAEKQ